MEEGFFLKKLSNHSKRSLMKWPLPGTSPAPHSLTDTAVVNSCVTGINQALVDMCYCMCVCECVCEREGQRGVCGLGESNLMSDRSA